MQELDERIQQNIAEKQYDQKVLKSGLWYVFSEILVRGISFFATPVYTRILPTAVFGSVRIFESWVQLLVPIISLNLHNSIERAKLDFKKDFDAYISSIVSLGMLLFLGIGTVFMLFKDTVKQLLSFSESMFWIFPLYGFAYFCTICMQKRERQMLNYKSNIAISFLSVIPSVSLSIALLLILGDNASEATLTDIRIQGFYIPLILLGLALMVITFRRGKTFLNLSYWHFGVAFSAPLIAYAISAQVLYQSDKIMIQRMCGESLAGIYSLATTVVYIVDIVSNALHGAWMPWLFEKLERKRTNEVWSVWWVLLVGMAVLSWGIVLLAPEVVWFLGGEKYKSARWLLGSMLSAGVFQFVMLLFVSLEKFYKRTKVSGWAGTISAVINIVLNWACISKFGYQAAAYTTAFSYFAAVLLHYSLMHGQAKKAQVPIVKMVLFCVGVWAVNMATMLLFDRPLIVRTLIAVPILLVAVLVGGKRLLAQYRKPLEKLK